MKDKVEEVDKDEELDEEWDEEHQMIVRAKWSMNDAKTLSEAAEMLKSFAGYLKKLEKEGWQLESPVCDDYGFLRKK